MNELSANAQKVAIALAIHLGGEANLRDIYRIIRTEYPEWAEPYKDKASFEGTVRNAIESYCPSSKNWSVEREALFEHTGRGRCRAVPVSERERLIARTRHV